MYEDDGASYDAAVALGNSADYFVAEAMLPQAVHCLRRAGAHLVDEERYNDAWERFDRAATLSLDDNLLKFNAPPIALDAALCLLCLRDDERTLRYVRDVSDRDLNFVVSREKRFLLDLILCAQEGRLDDLTDHMWNFDYAAELEPHELAMLRVVFSVVEASMHAPGGDTRPDDSDGSDDSWDTDSDEDEDEDEDRDTGVRGRTGTGTAGTASGRRASARGSTSKKSSLSKAKKKTKKGKGGKRDRPSVLGGDGDDDSDGGGSIGTTATGFTRGTGTTAAASGGGGGR